MPSTPHQPRSKRYRYSLAVAKVIIQLITIIAKVTTGLLIAMILGFIWMVYSYDESDIKRPHGTCETPAEFHFRGYHFRFPITGEQAMQQTDGKLTFYGGTYFRKLVPADSQQIYWFTDPHNETKLNAKDTTNYLKQVNMFGVAFSVQHKNNPNPSPEQIRAELDDAFPGGFTHKKISTRSYYIQDRGCLKIVYFGFNGPDIAFLYGMDDELVEKFVMYPYFLYRDFH